MNGASSTHRTGGLGPSVDSLLFATCCNGLLLANMRLDNMRSYSFTSPQVCDRIGLLFADMGGGI